MSYKANGSGVGHEDQRLNVKDEFEISNKDVLAMIIATLQFVLPVFLLITAGIAVVLVLFQMFY